MPVPKFVLGDDSEEDDVLLPQPTYVTRHQGLEQRRIFCPNPKREVVSHRQLQDISSRFIPMLRPEKDIIILPAGIPEIREFFDFCCENLNIQENQGVFIPVGLLFEVDDLIDGLVSTLTEVINNSDGDPGELFCLAPYYVDSSMAALASKLGIPLLADDIEWMDAVGTRRILHRSVTKATETSVLEKLVDYINRVNAPEHVTETEGVAETVERPPGFNVRVPRGFVCEDISELVIAWRDLDVPVASIVPVVSPDSGESILHVTSFEEVRMYDFPFGSVIMQEGSYQKVTQDSDITSLPLIHFRGQYLFEDNILEKLSSQKSYRYWQHHDADRHDAIKKQFVTIASMMLKYLKPAGSGYFQFCVLKNEEIILIDYSAGVVSRSEVMVTMQDMGLNHGPKRSFMWRFTPPKNLDVWHFWSQLNDLNIQYDWKKKTGVFPLIYIRGIGGTFLAVCDDDKQLYELRDAVDGVLLENLSTAPKRGLKFIEMRKTKEECTRIYVWSPRGTHISEANRLGVPSLPLSIVRPKLDLIVLPESPELRQFVDLCSSIYDIDESQVVFSSGRSSTMLGDLIADQEVSSRLLSSVASCKSLLFPYENTPEFRDWSSVFSAHSPHYYAERPKFSSTATAGRDAYLAMYSDEGPASTICQELGIDSLPGFLCHSSDDALKAWDKLNPEVATIRKVCSNPFQNRPAVLSNRNQLELYPFPATEGEYFALELPTVVSKTGTYVGLAVVFEDGNMKDVIQVNMVNFFQETVMPLSTDLEEHRQTAIELATKLIQKVGARTHSVVTFGLIPGSKKLVLTDARMGAMSMYHVILINVVTRVPKDRIWSVSIARAPVTVDVFMAWNRLKKHGAQLIPGKTKKGVIPILYLKGIIALNLVVGRDQKEMDTLLKITSDVLVPANIQHIPRFSVFRRQDFRTKRTVSRIWVQSPSAEEVSSRLSARYSVPLLALPIVRPSGRDKCIITGNHVESIEFANFVRTILGLDEDQILMTSGESLLLSQNLMSDLSIQNELQNTIASSNSNFTLVPASPSPDFQAWATRLGETLDSTDANRRVSFFGDSSKWLEAHSRFGTIFPKWSDARDDSKVFQPAEGVVLPKGFKCYSMSELIEAYQHINSKTVTLTDLKSGVVSPASNVGELKLYESVSRGVLIKEVLPHDAAEDGLVVTPVVTFIGKEIVQGTGLMDCLTIGRRWVGQRPSRTCESEKVLIEKCAEEILDFLNPHGAGLITFFKTNGKIAVDNVMTGSFSRNHFLSMFSELYAPEESCMSAFVLSPPSNLDVWTYWTRLVDKGIAFVPGQDGANSGVFPFLYLRGMSAIIVILGTNDEELSRLKTLAEELLMESEKEMQVEVASFKSESLRRIWIQSCRPEYQRISQRMNLSFRSLALVRPGLDIIILPGEFEAAKEFVEFIREENNLKEDQIIFTGGTAFHMDDEVDEVIMSKLKSKILGSEEGPSGWALVPYANTFKFHRWAKELEHLGVKIIGEHDSWMDQYSSKGILHRHIQTPQIPSTLEKLGVGKVNVPRGWVCDTVEDLLLAWRELDVTKAALKPVFGAAGEGIFFPESEDELRTYDFRMGQVLLEEFCDLDFTSDGVCLSPAVHYIGNETVGQLVDQIMVGTSYGGWRTTHADDKFVQKCNNIIKAVVSRLNPSGPGGFDFLSVHGEPLLTDVNTGRFNGSHFPKLWIEQNAFGRPWICLKRKPPINLPISMWLWRLGKMSCRFTAQKRRGVFPLNYIPGLSGQFMGVGRDAMDVECMQEKIINSLNIPTPEELREFETFKEGLECMEETNVPGRSSLALTLIKNAESIYGPKALPKRKKHILVASEKIIGLLDDEQMKDLEPLCQEVHDVNGCVLVPGFVDVHVHITGGGGEAGPASRTPEAKMYELVAGGVTTAIGVLGTDGYSRSVANLMQKCRALKAEGMSCFMYTGNYHVPPPTHTGSLTGDVVTIPECIGVGEIAISDHRGSQITSQELSEVAAQARVAGMLSGKAGVVYCHVGKGQTKLGPIRTIIKESDVPITQILPTHCHRSQALIDDSIQWCKEGGFADFTAGSANTLHAIVDADSHGVLDHCMISSDAFGSSPVFDKNGILLRYKVGDVHGLLRIVKQLYFHKGWPLEKALSIITHTPANYMQLSGKGHIEINGDADIVALDAKSLEIKYVFCRGTMKLSPDYRDTGFFSYDE